MHKKFIVITLISLLLLSFVSLVFVNANGSKDGSDYVLDDNSFNAKFVQSNKYTNMENDSVANSFAEITSDFEYLLTDGDYDVYVNLSDLSFRIKNKTNGYIFGSNVYDEDNFVGGQNISNAIEPISITYYPSSINTIAQSEEMFNENEITGATKATFESALLPNGYAANITFNKSQISLQLQVYFENGEIKVVIPKASIKENGTALLATINVFRFFGGVYRNKVDGYILIPDGAGALVRYSNEYAPTRVEYSKPVYGYDLGYTKNAAMESEANISMPVFGFVHGVKQNGIFAIIESAEEYASINLVKASRTYKYTSVYPSFRVRPNYLLPVSAVTGTTVSQVGQMMDEDIVIRYKYLSGDYADYVGMAKTYREYLKEKGFESHKITDSNVKAGIFTIGLEKEKTLLGYSNVVMTKINEFKNILDDLSSNDVNVLPVMIGFTNSGYVKEGALYKNVSSKLGSKNDLKNLLNAYSDTSFYTDFLYARDGNGYGKKSNYALSYGNKFFTVESVINQSLLRPSKSLSAYKESMKSLNKLGINNLVLPHIGEEMYSDKKDGDSRSKVASIYSNIVKDIDNVSLYSPNIYLAIQCNNIFSTPLYSSGYYFFDDTVPFYSLVLGEYVNLYSSYINYYASLTDGLLRIIDFNVYPTYMLTEKSSQLLTDTSLKNIYSSKYADLKMRTITSYGFVNNALKEVIGASIMARTILANGIVKVDYSNGVSIYINYTTNDYVDTVTVKAKDYLVVGGGL